MCTTRTIFKIYLCFQVYLVRTFHVVGIDIVRIEIVNLINWHEFYKKGWAF